MTDVRPIDANALLDLYTSTDNSVDIHAYKVPIPVVVQNILDQPTLDYAPVGRGQWEDGAFENSKRCTNCGRYSSKIYPTGRPFLIIYFARTAVLNWVQ